jgi:hypothetical protein
MKTDDFSSMDKMKWVFVIDTEQYAGNFCREMCAFVTGRIGECRVGFDFYKLYQKQTHKLPMSKVLEVMDDHGVCRPCSIWLKPGSINTETENVKDYERNYCSVAIFFLTKPTKKEMDFIMERALLFGKTFPEGFHGYETKSFSKINVTGFRLFQEINTYKVIMSIKIN